MSNNSISVKDLSRITGRAESTLLVYLSHGKLTKAAPSVVSKDPVLLEWLTAALDNTVKPVADRRAVKGLVSTLKGTLVTVPTPEPAPAALDTQIGGDHYDMPIQPVEFSIKNGLGFAEGCVVKYISRHRRKGGLQDLLKAKYYVQILIESEYAGQA